MVIFRNVDKLIVIITPNVCKIVFRYIRRWNRYTESEYYNNKIIHMVFDKNKTDDKKITTIIIKSLFNKIKNHKISIVKGLDKKQSFGELKNIIESLEQSCKYLQKYFYELTSEHLIFNKSKLEEEFNSMLFSVGIKRSNL